MKQFPSVAFIQFIYNIQMIAENSFHYSGCLVLQRIRDFPFSFLVRCIEMFYLLAN